MVDPNKDEIVALAELCIGHGLYKDACNFIKTIITKKSRSKTQLTVAEANMLTDCWNKESKPLMSFINLSKEDANANLKKFLIKIARDIKQLTDAYVKLIDRCMLLKNSEYTDTYYKLFKGTLQLISANVAPDNEIPDFVEQSMQNLEDAKEWASQNLSPCDQIRLRMGVTLSQFHFSRNEEAKAIDIAREAYNECMNARHEQQLEQASLSALTALKGFLDSRDQQ